LPDSQVTLVGNRTQSKTVQTPRQWRNFNL